MRQVMRGDSGSVKKRRIVALTVLLPFFFASILLNAFILSHAEHDHDSYGADIDCEVCISIHHVKNLLTFISSVAKNTSAELADMLLLSALLYAAMSACDILTPIRSKTRMNT